MIYANKTRYVGKIQGSSYTAQGGRGIRRTSMQVKVGTEVLNITKDHTIIPQELLLDPSKSFQHNFVPGDTIIFRSPDHHLQVQEILDVERRERTEDVFAYYIQTPELGNNPKGELHALAFTRNKKGKQFAVLPSTLFEHIDYIQEDKDLSKGIPRAKSLFERLPAGALLKTQTVLSKEDDTDNKNYIQRIRKVYTKKELDEIFFPSSNLTAEQQSQNDTDLGKILELIQAYDYYTATEYLKPEILQVHHQIKTPYLTIPITFGFSGDFRGRFIKEDRAITWSLPQFNAKGVLRKNDQDQGLDLTLDLKQSLNFWTSLPVHKTRQEGEFDLSPASSTNKEDLEESLEKFVKNTVPRWLANPESYAGYIARLLLGRESYKPPTFCMDPEELIQPELPELLGEEYQIFFNAALNQKVPLSFLIGPPGTGKTTAAILLIANILQRNPKAKILIAGPSNASVNVIQIRLDKWCWKTSHLYLQVRIIPTHLDPEKYKGCEFAVPQIFSRTPQPGEDAGLTRFRNDYESEESSLVGSSIPDVGEPGRAEWMEELHHQLKTHTMHKDQLEFWAIEDRNPNIWASTLSATQSEFFKERLFDYIIVDEAGQSRLGEFLFALRLIKPGGQVFCFGDHNQLAPLVLSRGLGADYLKISPAEAIARNDKVPIVQLIECFRCIFALIEFNSTMFYGRSLISNVHPIERNCLTSRASLPTKYPLLWLNVRGFEYEDESSLSNIVELEATLQLVDHLLYISVQPDQIQILTPYRSQLNLFEEKLPPGIQASTIDNFQGNEKEIIILSTVRSTPHPQNQRRNLNPNSVGFLDDFKRVNVGTSRQKDALIFVGDANHMARETQYWRPLLNHLQSVNAIQDSVEYLLNWNDRT